MSKHYFSKLFLFFFIFFSFFLIIETENYKFPTSKTFIALFISNIIIISIFFFKEKRFLIYVNLFVFFILIFFINIFLFIKNPSNTSTIKKFKFVNENNNFPEVPPITHLKNNLEILPLSGLSNVMTVTANENNYWGNIQCLGKIECQEK